MPQHGPAKPVVVFHPQPLYSYRLLPFAGRDFLVYFVSAAIVLVLCLPRTEPLWAVCKFKAGHRPYLAVTHGSASDLVTGYR